MDQGMLKRKSIPCLDVQETTRADACEPFVDDDTGDAADYVVLPSQADFFFSYSCPRSKFCKRFTSTKRVYTKIQQHKPAVWRGG